MKHFILTSSQFEGSVSFKYDEAGYLVWFHYMAEMDNQKREYLLSHLPLTLSGFDYLVKKSPTAKIEEVPEDLSFEAFWNAYDMKHNRKRCEPLWNRLSESDKLRCIKSIARYNAYLKRVGWIGKKHPDGYLSNRYFETEWDKMK